MELSDRKKQILRAIVDIYVSTAEPVGSKAIAALPDMSFSSATIRNEMAELTQMGLLEQPHPSAGRVPSAAGYRLYIDELMQDYRLSVDETKSLSGAMELDAVLGDDEIKRDDSIKKRLLVAIENCAALLAAFDRDLQDETLSVWQERRPYWLKSFGSAFVATEDPLYLNFEDDGTVTLSTLEGQYLAVGKLGRVLLSDSQNDVITHFRFGREPLLTLYPDGDQKRLIAQIRGQLHCIRRVSHLQGNLFLSQVSFALVNQMPENARPMLR